MKDLREGDPVLSFGYDHAKQGGVPATVIARLIPYSRGEFIIELADGKRMNRFGHQLVYSPELSLPPITYRRFKAGEEVNVIGLLSESLPGKWTVVNCADAYNAANDLVMIENEEKDRRVISCSHLYPAA